MTVEIRFFASLKQKFTIDRLQVEHDDGMTVASAWDQATGNSERPANTLCAVNLEYARFSTALQDGDEVAFFPPVTGG